MKRVDQKACREEGGLSRVRIMADLYAARVVSVWRKHFRVCRLCERLRSVLSPGISSELRGEVNVPGRTGHQSRSRELDFSRYISVGHAGAN
jgi:hypothetical protein